MNDIKDHSFMPLLRYIRNRETMSPLLRLDEHAIIENRIETLVQSRRHAIPMNNKLATAGTSAMSFDDSENRFLLCGNTRGIVSIVDFDSQSSLSIAANPSINHTVIPTQSKHRHSSMVNCCQWYPVDSSIFVTSGKDKLLKIWDANRLSAVDQYAFDDQPPTQFHWNVSQNCSLIAVPTSSSNVTLLDTRAGSRIQQIRCVQKRIWSVRWLHSSQYVLATGSDSGDIMLWDVRSTKAELNRISLPSGANRKRRKSKTRKNCLVHTRRLTCLRCSEDGRFLVSYSQDKTICLWEPNTLRLLSCFQIAEASSDVSTLSVSFELCEEGHSLWAFVPSGNEILLVKLPFTSGFHDDGIESAGGKNCIKLYGHFQSAISCAYRKTYQQLVTSSTDRLISVWAPKMEEISSDSATQQIQSLYADAYSDDEG